MPPEKDVESPGGTDRPQRRNWIARAARLASNFAGRRRTRRPADPASAPAGSVPVGTSGLVPGSAFNDKGNSEHIASRSAQFKQRMQAFAHSGLNYLHPDKYQQLDKDFDTMLVVTSLLIGGTYQALYNGYQADQRPCNGAPATPSDTCPVCGSFTMFTTLNYIAFGFSLIAAILALMGTIALRHSKLQPWPAGWDDLRPPPDVISIQNFSQPGFVHVEKFARALNFMWHASTGGLIPEGWQKVLRTSVIAGWISLLLSFILTLAAASSALEHQAKGCRGYFLASMVTVTPLSGLSFSILLLWAGNKFVPFYTPITATKVSSAGSARQVLTEIGKYNIDGSHNDIFNIGSGASQFSSTGVWPQAVKLARREAIVANKRFIFSCKPALDLHEHMATGYAVMASILEDVAAWKQLYGDFYAVKVMKDKVLATTALKYRAELEAVWNKLDRKVENGVVTLDEFFTSGSYGPVWLRRARRYRDLGEPLEIVYWYYRNKHLDDKHYLSDDFIDTGKDGWYEYHRDPKVNMFKEPLLVDGATSASGERYGGYEEWLVRGGVNRPDRYRLIHEAEARALVREEDGTYKQEELDFMGSFPDTSLELAALLRVYLKQGGEATLFADFDVEDCLAFCNGNRSAPAERQLSGEASSLDAPAAAALTAAGPFAGPLVPRSRRKNRDLKVLRLTPSVDTPSDGESVQD